ncbi:hypothetical protein GQ473_02915 [archaeon]|nr:hypothetical protein [archaeon]
MFGMGKKDDKKEIKETIDNSKSTSTMFGRDFTNQSDASINNSGKNIEAPKPTTQPMPQSPKTVMPTAPQTLPPVTTPTKPIENTVTNTPPVKQNPQNIPPKVDPVNNLTLPSLSKNTGAQTIHQINKKETKRNNISSIPPIQKVTPRSFTNAKGPVFVSVKRYKELMSALNDLKYNASHLRQIIADLKQNRDTGTGQLSETADALSSLEDNIEKVNASINA